VKQPLHYDAWTHTTKMNKFNTISRKTSKQYLRYLRFSRQSGWWWWWCSSGFWCHVDSVDAKILEKHTVPIFRAEMLVFTNKSTLAPKLWRKSSSSIFESSMGEASCYTVPSKNTTYKERTCYVKKLHSNLTQPKSMVNQVSLRIHLNKNCIWYDLR
jgi:hypothetical protein